jgi:hypothetical protein
MALVMVVVGLDVGVGLELELGIGIGTCHVHVARHYSVEPAWSAALQWRGIAYISDHRITVVVVVGVVVVVVGWCKVQGGKVQGAIRLLLLAVGFIVRCSHRRGNRK